MPKKFLPEVFIVESLRVEDEAAAKFEGSLISQMLILHGKRPKYRYVSTRHDLEEALKDFGRSRYRYLHLSCHGGDDGIELRNCECLDVGELADQLKPYAKDRRLFLSACALASPLLAEAMRKFGWYSIVGPTDDVGYRSSAILFTSLYHLMFKRNRHVMSTKELEAVLDDVARLFSVNMATFSRPQAEKKGRSTRTKSMRMHLSPKGPQKSTKPTPS